MFSPENTRVLRRDEHRISRLGESAIVRSHQKAHSLFLEAKEEAAKWGLKATWEDGSDCMAGRDYS